MQESIRRTLLGLTIIDIEDLIESTTFYLENEHGTCYSVEVKSGETNIRILDTEESVQKEKIIMHEVWGAKDIESLKGFTLTDVSDYESNDPELGYSEEITLSFTGPEREKKYLSFDDNGSMFLGCTSRSSYLPIHLMNSRT